MIVSAAAAATTACWLWNSFLVKQTFPRVIASLPWQTRLIAINWSFYYPIYERLLLLLLLLRDGSRFRRPHLLPREPRSAWYPGREYICIYISCQNLDFEDFTFAGCGTCGDIFWIALYFWNFAIYVVSILYITRHRLISRFNLSRMKLHPKHI